MTDSAGTLLITAALDALKRGWSVLPVQGTGTYAKRPHYCLTETGHVKQEDGKLKPSWVTLQTIPPTAEQVRIWYARPTGKGLAVVTGAISSLVILDFDGPEGEALREQLDLNAHVRTGSGGAHVYFQHPGWQVPTLNSKAKREMGERWPGLDIRADGGYAVMPPSTNAQGPYSWTEDGPPELLPLTMLPDELRAFLGLANPPVVFTPAPRAAEPSRASQSQTWGNGQRVPGELLIERALTQVSRGEGRNNAGSWLAGQLRDNGYSAGEALPYMASFADQVPPYNTQGHPEPYTVAEARASVHSIYSRAARDPWTARNPIQDLNGVPSNLPSRTTALPTPAEPAHVAQPLTGDGPVIVTGDAAFCTVEEALRQPHAENAVARRTLTADELHELVQAGRAAYVLTPTQAQERALDASGVEWYALPALPLTATSSELLTAIQEAMLDAFSGGLTGSLEFLQDRLPDMADERLKRGGYTYPTGLPGFDEAIGGGFYDGLHVLGGVTGGGKTALALAIAEHNAREGRPVLYVTFEQSRYELWGRIISSRVGVSLRQLRTGGTAEHPVSGALRENAAYQDLTQNVAPYLSVFEGNGVDGGAWGVDRIAAQVRRLKAAHGVAPLVMLDYLQRMPAVDNKDRRHQIDDVVMALQVRLGRELNTPILLISSVGRGKYGDLIAAPLEERLGVFKESGGVEYTAYTASLLYPLSAKTALFLGLDTPPVPGGTRAALTGLWKYLVLDLVKNREGEAPRLWVVKWYPARGSFELIRPVDPADVEGMEAPVNSKKGRA